MRPPPHQPLLPLELALIYPISAAAPDLRATTPSLATPLIGSLCSGYGGLDLGVQSALGGTLAWHAEVDPNASRILARHWPGVPNLGDITAVDWSTVPRVCVLTAGFPCQRRLGRRPPGRTSGRTAAASIHRSGRAGGTVRTWPTRSSGCCCRPRRRRTESRARRTSGTATAT
ncbi:DNA cytosine methyltransferase [Streptomyces sp. NPDC007020]|uniref:DNA cytosine methyltransferase n=1 Tax=Streptomyces sp. NPDC007020 TaxID=3154585 RepID=UPI0033F98776